MVSMLPTCGNCRSRNDELQRDIVLESHEQMDSDEEGEDLFSIGEGTISTTLHVVPELTTYRRDRR